MARFFDDDAGFGFVDDSGSIQSLAPLESAVLEDLDALGGEGILDEVENVLGDLSEAKGKDWRAWLKTWEREGYVAPGQSQRWRTFKRIWLEAASNPDVVRRALKEAADVMKADAVANAPFDPEPDDLPHLRKMIRTRSKKGRKGRDYVAEATVGVYHREVSSVARFQEFGTERHDAQPFLQPAFDRKEGETVEKFQDRVLDHYFKGLG